jgi:hypothetical protein
MVEWVRHVARVGKINEYRILVVVLKEKTLLGRQRRRWEDNIKVYIWEIVLEGAYGIQLAQGGSRR